MASDKDKKQKKSSFLTTNQWLGETTPAPQDAPLRPDLSAESTDAMAQPELFGAKDAETPPPSKIIARSELADLTAHTAFSEESDDDSIDLATPPGGATTGPPSLSKILKATGTKSDILRGVKGSDSGTNLGISGPGSGWLAAKITPPAKSGGSRVDIGNTPRVPEEASDIFSSARAEGSSVPPPSGTGTNLPGMSGIGRNSIFNDPSKAGASSGGLGMGAESDLFAGLTSTDRGSSMYDDSSKKTQRVAPEDDGDSSESINLAGDDLDDGTELDARPLHSGPTSSARLADRLLAGLVDSGAMQRPDFNALDKSTGGSNLFDDVTALDIDLSTDAGASGTSGLNWLDPNRSADQDSAPNSSIFIRPPSDQASDQGHVDFSHIPLMGSTDDPDQQVQNFDIDNPPSSVLKKELEKTMLELNSEQGAVSFDHLPPSAAGDDGAGADWLATDRQASTRMSVSDEELDLAAPSGMISGLSLGNKKAPKDSDSVFDDSHELGDDQSGILVKHTGSGMSGSMSGSILKGVPNDTVRYNTDSLPSTSTKTSKKVRSKSTEVDLDVGTSPRKSRGLLVGVLGLLLGAGAGAGAMYYFADSKPTPPAGNKDAFAAYALTQDANRALAAGDPSTAFDLFTRVNNDKPETIAGRGQSRWMNRQREVAANKKKLTANDPELIAAVAELQSVVDRGAELETAADKRAGLRAAINLGLIMEATQRPKEAIAFYESMGAKMSTYKKVFDSAKTRVTLMRKTATGGVVPDSQYSFAWDDAYDLARVSVILLDFEPVQPLDDEPGFHFWDAVNASADATATSLGKAIDAINRAKAAHATRRLKLVGMGLNPLTDPTEQMFLRSCDELNNYWTFKKKLYSDSAVVASMKGKTVDAILTDLIDAKKRVAGADAQIARLKKAAEDADMAANTATAAMTVAKSAKETAEKAIETLKTDVADKTKAINEVRLTAEAATAKLKAADAALDPLIAQLKTAKVIDEKATREQAIAALPEVAKKAVLIGGGTGEAATMARELVALKEQTTKDMADAGKKIAALETAAKEADEKVKAAVAKEKQETRTIVQNMADKIAERELVLKRERELVAAKLAAAAKDHQEQIAAVRAGATVAMSDSERDAIDQAAKAYGLGVDAYFANRVGDAEGHLINAVGKNPNDARYWYFLGLSKVRQGRNGSEDFKKGAALESKGLPRSDSISSELSAVQGSPRAALEAIRP